MIDRVAVHSSGQLIWRYHPETRRYEIFAEGGGNPFCTEFDAQGRLYSGHNGGNARGFHYLQGGYYFKGEDGGGGGKYGALSNPYVFGILPYVTIPAIAVAAVWTIAAMVVAVRQALDYTSTSRAIAVCVIGWSLAVVFSIALGLLFGPTVS